METRVELAAWTVDVKRKEAVFRMRRNLAEPTLVDLQVEVPRQDVGPPIQLTVEDLIRGLQSILPDCQVLVAPTPRLELDARRSTEEPKVLLERDSSS